MFPGVTSKLLEEGADVLLSERLLEDGEGYHIWPSALLNSYLNLKMKWTKLWILHPTHAELLLCHSPGLLVTLCHFAPPESHGLWEPL
jgi:hypothetical protein